MSNIKNNDDDILTQVCEIIRLNVSHEKTLGYHDIINIWNLNDFEFEQIISNAVKKLNLHTCLFQTYKYIVLDDSYSFVEITSVDLENNTITTISN